MAEAMQRAGPPMSWSDIPWDLAGRVLHLLPAWTAPTSPPCARSGAARRDSSSCPAAPTSKPPPVAAGSSSRAMTAASWSTPGATVKLPSLSRIRLRPSNAVERIGHPYMTWLGLNDAKRTLTLNKLILCSPNLVAAMFDDGPICQILMCQPGASSWSVRAYDACMPYEDMTFYQGKLYALIAGGENLLVVNISQDPSTGDPQVARIGQVINGDPDPSFEAWLPDNTMHTKKLYLVESCGALLMIRRKICCRLVNGSAVAGRTIEFQVLEADWENSRWVKMATLGDDLMLFLGRSCSKVVRASQYGMLGDQIFFLDDVFENDENNQFIIEGNTSASLYDMRTGEISSPLPMVWKRKMVLATWLFPLK